MYVVRYEIKPRLDMCRSRLICFADSFDFDIGNAARAEIESEAIKRVHY